MVLPSDARALAVSVLVSPNETKVSAVGVTTTEETVFVWGWGLGLGSVGLSPPQAYATSHPTDTTRAVAVARIDLFAAMKCFALRECLMRPPRKTAL